MLGHRVEIQLANPIETVHGMLQKQTPEGVTVYVAPTVASARNVFYPFHRILSIADKGDVYR